jgi:hypothetical protein
VHVALLQACRPPRIGIQSGLLHIGLGVEHTKATSMKSLSILQLVALMWNLVATHSFRLRSRPFQSVRSVGLTVLRETASAGSAEDAKAAKEAAEEARVKRVLSGVQPTGTLHLGNYLGNTYIHIYIHIHTHTHTHIYTYIHTHTHIHTHTYTHTYIHTHTHIHTHTQTNTNKHAHRRHSAVGEIPREVRQLLLRGGPARHHDAPRPQEARQGDPTGNMSFNAILLLYYCLLMLFYYSITMLLSFNAIILYLYLYICLLIPFYCRRRLCTSLVVSTHRRVRSSCRAT